MSIDGVKPFPSYATIERSSYKAGEDASKLQKDPLENHAHQAYVSEGNIFTEAAKVAAASNTKSCPKNNLSTSYGTSTSAAKSFEEIMSEHPLASYVPTGDGENHPKYDKSEFMFNYYC
ncbi:MAG: hypothetical protein IJ003_04675 [Candidatus Gastranaerophilales bacterium]|nr:hypothetical protein [Candidatus Gastranaerophilales bacterium]